MQKSYRYTTLALIAFALWFLPGALFAQTAPAPATPDAQNFLISFFELMMVKFPVLTTVVAFMGSMRVWAKPLISFVHFVIDTTPSKFDDGIYAKVFVFFTENAFGKSLAYALDYFTSIKIVPPQSK